MGERRGVSSIDSVSVAYQDYSLGKVALGRIMDRNKPLGSYNIRSRGSIHIYFVIYVYVWGTKCSKVEKMQDS